MKTKIGQSPIKKVVEDYLIAKGIEWDRVYREHRKRKASIVEHGRSLKFFGLTRFKDTQLSFLNLHLNRRGFKLIVLPGGYRGTSIRILPN